MKYEILKGLPGTGPIPEMYSSDGLKYFGEGLVICFWDKNGNRWIGNFQKGATSLNYIGLHPNGNDAIVLAGGTGYILDIETKAMKESFGGIITELFDIKEMNVIVFFEQFTFYAYGSSGFIWKSKRITFDKIRFLQIDNTRLLGEAANIYGDKWIPFEINLFTGESKGGSYFFEK